MSNNFEIQVFENVDFGEMRSCIENDGTILFCASDVAKALGYSRPNDAVNAHCRATVKRRTPISGKTQEINFIPEGDVYRLIVKSKLPSAVKFEHWVFDEVIPLARHIGHTFELLSFQGNIDGLVYSKNGTATTTSRKIAEVFGKSHKEVLRLY